MKSSLLLVIGIACGSFWGSHAFSADAQAPKLTGIVIFSAGPQALVELPSTSGREIIKPILGTGESTSGWEMLHIDAALGKVTLRTPAGEQTIFLGSGPAAPPINRTIDLRQADFAQVLEVYQKFAGHTVLRPPVTETFRPDLPPGAKPSALPRYDLQTHGDATPEQAAELIEDAFRTHGLIVERRAKFTFIVPKEKINLLSSISPPPEMPTDPKEIHEEVFPPGLIKFQDTDSSQVLDYYAALSQKQLLRHPLLPAMKITVRTQTELIRSQAVWCLDALLKLGEIDPIHVGENVVLLLPSSIAKTIPRHDPVRLKEKLKSNAAPTEIKLLNDTLKNFLVLYAELTGREPLPIPAGTPEIGLSFMSRKPLRPEDAIFVLESLAEINGLRFHLIGEKQVEIRSKEVPGKGAK